LQNKSLQRSIFTYIEGLWVGPAPENFCPRWYYSTKEI